jgi:hypothetical protein
MGYGNVSTSLSLAKYQLAQQGITNPTPEQLKIALNGGTITYEGKTVEYQGILQMRADGMGWGQIAQQLGTKLGPVVSGIKSQNAHLASLPAAKRATTTTRTDARAATGASPVRCGRTAARRWRQGHRDRVRWYRGAGKCERQGHRRRDDCRKQHIDAARSGDRDRGRRRRIARGARRRSGQGRRGQRFRGFRRRVVGRRR